ncbi:hypothetical protein [Kitasatospora griseola]|uniref:hypothetical protein n=1 Tax=Kitasatospora griseola TaxID=2064 RepID=UPI00382663C1
MPHLSDEESALLDQAAVALLNDLPAWRLRAVERIELSSALWSERKREIHVKPLVTSIIPDDATNDTQPMCALRKVIDPRFWNPFKPARDSVSLILPITDMPAVPILDLHITVNEQEVYRIPIDESARIQAKHIAHLANEAGLVVSDGLIQLLTAIFYFPPSSYEESWKKYHHPSARTLGYWDQRDSVDVVKEYLHSSADDFAPEASPPFDIVHFYPKWHEISRDIQKIVNEYTISEYLSGAEYPLAALPYFFRELWAQPAKWLPSGDEVTHLLTALQLLLRDAQASNDPAARRLLATYCGYGMRWMAFARCTIPLDKAFIMTVAHKRAVYFTKTRDASFPIRDNFRKTAYTMVAFADAETNHVSVRVADTAIRLHKPEARDALGRRFEGSKRTLDEEVRTFELYFRQDSTRRRAERIWIKLPLRLTRLHSGMLWLTMAITAFGIVLLSVRGVVDDDLTPKDATVILVPVAFAAAFLLARDASTLSMRVRQVRQAILLAELFVLLTMAFFLLLIHYITDPATPMPMR